MRPVRRHSFNSCKSTTTTAPESGDSHYEADAESSHSGHKTSANTVGNSNGNNTNDNSSLSDSEAGLVKPQQAQVRIRSLWGSFRKKRNMPEQVQVRGPVRPAPAVPPTGHGCFGECVNHKNSVASVHNPVDSSASSSYHTPGSPAKQQSESSSSLSR